MIWCLRKVLNDTDVLNIECNPTMFNLIIVDTSHVKDVCLEANTQKRKIENKGCIIK